MKSLLVVIALCVLLVGCGESREVRYNRALSTYNAELQVKEQLLKDLERIAAEKKAVVDKLEKLVSDSDTKAERTIAIMVEAGSSVDEISKLRQEHHAVVKKVQAKNDETVQLMEEKYQPQVDETSLSLKSQEKKIRIAKEAVDKLKP